MTSVKEFQQCKVLETALFLGMADQSVSALQNSASHHIKAFEQETYLTLRFKEVSLNVVQQIAMT